MVHAGKCPRESPGQLKSFIVEDPHKFNLHCQFHSCWWPDDTRRKGIGSYGIALFFSGHFSFNHRLHTSQVSYEIGLCRYVAVQLLIDTRGAVVSTPKGLNLKFSMCAQVFFATSGCATDGNDTWGGSSKSKSKIKTKSEIKKKRKKLYIESVQ